MSGVTFNRKRIKLKKLLGIRARLALLAVLLVAPLMLDRARSLEDTRAKQIAQAAEEYTNLAEHSAETQREVISSVETMLKSAAYIRASSGIGRSCDMMRASLPANLPWIRSIMIVEQRWRGAVLDAQHSCRPRPSATGRISRRPATPAILSSATFLFGEDQQPADHDGGLSGRRHQPRGGTRWFSPASISTGWRRSWPISAAGRAFRQC